MEQANCKKCIYGKKFDKRSDEPSEWGCFKPNWEGYTDPDKPMCDGVFFEEKKSVC